MIKLLDREEFLKVANKTNEQLDNLINQSDIEFINSVSFYETYLIDDIESAKSLVNLICANYFYRFDELSNEDYICFVPSVGCYEYYHNAVIVPKINQELVNYFED